MGDMRPCPVGSTCGLPACDDGWCEALQKFHRSLLPQIEPTRNQKEEDHGE